MEIITCCFAASQEAFVGNVLEIQRNICGPVLKRLRHGRGLSQSQLAVRCQLAGWDVDRKLLSKIEIGLRELVDYEIRILASVLAVKPDSFFTMSAEELLSAFRIVSEEVE